MSTALQQWLRKIPGDLFALDERPLLGYPPVFPWDSLTKNLAETFQLKHLQLAPSEWQWRTSNDLFAGLGDQCKCLGLTIVPLEGTIYWIMPEQEISNLMQALLSKPKNTPPENIDPEFRKAFYRFLSVEVLGAFEKIDFDKKLSPSLLQNEVRPTGHCLALDITITLDQHSFHGRLLLSPEFRKSWANRYQQSTAALLSLPIADSLDVIVHLEAGKVSLKRTEWQQIKTGDCLILDSCSLDPNEDKGRIQFVINGTPYFRARLKQGKIKILEHPLYHEVDTSMASPPNNNNNHDDNHSSLGDDHSEEEDLFDDSEFDSEMGSEVDESFYTEADVTTESSIGEDFEIEDDEGNGETPDAQKQPVAASKKTATSSATSVEKAPSAPSSIEDLPLNIVVEVGRIQMSIKKIAELQPGNMLELDIHPEKGVDLVVNGKRIARGELLQIGDALGIRIIELS